MSNPTSQKTTAAPSNKGSIEISSRTAIHAPIGAIEMATPNQKCDNEVKRLANEYPKTINKATGDSKNASVFNLKAENKKTTVDNVRKIQ